jgi:hypothetical protein
VRLEPASVANRLATLLGILTHSTRENWRNHGCSCLFPRASGATRDLLHILKMQVVATFKSYSARHLFHRTLRWHLLFVYCWCEPGHLAACLKHIWRQSIPVNAHDRADIGRSKASSSFKLQRFCAGRSLVFHARDQRRTFDAHAGGGALRTRNPALGLFEDVQNLIAVSGLSRASRGNGSAIAADLSNW